MLHQHNVDRAGWYQPFRYFRSSVRANGVHSCPCSGPNTLAGIVIMRDPRSIRNVIVDRRSAFLRGRQIGIDGVTVRVGDRLRGEAPHPSRDRTLPQGMRCRRSPIFECFSDFENLVGVCINCIQNLGFLMSYATQNSNLWTPKLVGEVLVEMARWLATHGGRVGPARLRSVMPELAMELADRLSEGWSSIQANQVTHRRPSYGPRAVSLFERALDWQGTYLLGECGAGRVLALWLRAASPN